MPDPTTQPVSRPVPRGGRRPRVRAALGLAAGLLLLPGLSAAAQAAPDAAAPAGAWYQYGANGGHSGDNPYERQLTPKTVPSLQQAWTAPGGESPLVVGGRVYSVADDRSITARTLATGSLVWRRTATRCTDGAEPPVVHQTVLLVPTDGCGAGTDTLEAYAAGTGAPLWVRDVPERVTSATASDGVLYLTSGFGKGVITALDVHTGAVRWSRTGAGEVIAAAVGDGVLYTGIWDGRLQGRRLTDGAPLWDHSVFDDGYMWLAADGAALYVGFFEYGGAVPQQELTRFTSAGDEVWTTDLFRDEGYRTAQPTIAGDLVLVSTVGAEVHALDAATGKRRWGVATRSGSVSAVSVAGDVAYTVEGTTLRARALATGKALWSTPAPESRLGPSVSAGRVVVGGDTVTTYRLPVQP